MISINTFLESNAASKLLSENGKCNYIDTYKKYINFMHI